MTNGTGVIRPYTLVDVLGTIYDQASLGNTGNTALTTPLSAVGEVDETVTSADSATALSSAPKGWDQEVWGIPWS